MDCLVVALRFNNTEGGAQETDGLYEISTPLFFGLDTFYQYTCNDKSMQFLYSSAENYIS